MAKFDATEIGELVHETEAARSDWRDAADVWESMWSLQRYNQSRRIAKELDQMEKVVTADPFNIVQLVTRFVASDMRVEIPYLSAEDDDDERSTTIEEWLMSFWQRSGRQQGRNLIDDMTWYSAVRGRGALQVVWCKDALPEGLADKRLPILPRVLDPFNVGIARGPYWTAHAYHKYKAKASYISQQYPKYKFKEDHKYAWQAGKKEYTVIDFYWMDAGSVWNAVSIDNEFVKNPIKTDYAEIPIIEWYADGAPIDDELAKSLSILHPIKDLWEYKCDLASAIGTGLLYYFDPIVKAIGFNKDIEIFPGAVVQMPNPNMNLDFVRGEPNVPMAEKMLEIIQSSMDQSTFPAVLYGEQPGGVQAGFAINNLATQARNRVKTIRGNQEGALEAANELILSQVEIMGGKDGVEVWGSSAMTDRSRPTQLSSKQIRGVYANEVSLIPEIPTDENGRIQIWLQMVDKGIVSKSTMRNRAINMPLPRDEETRIAVEKAMDDPAMAPKVALRAFQRRFKKDTLELLISGTPIGQVEEQEQQWLAQKKTEKDAAQEAKRQQKMQEQQAQMMAQNPPMLPPMPQGMPPQGMPPGMPPQMPPGSMPPMPPQDSLPPGMPPGSPPDFGAPGTEPPGLPAPDTMQPQGITNVPPQAAGQLTPDMLGITPNAPPGTFQQAIGEPLPDNEILKRLAARGQ